METMLERRTREAEETRMRALLRLGMDRRPRYRWSLELPTMAQWRELRLKRIPVGDGREV
jgi:hypothetical protein